MIRFVAAALWILAAALGTLYFAYSATGSGQDGTAGEEAAHSDFMRTGIMSVPVIRDGKVQGYFLTKLVYATDPVLKSKMQLPLDSVLVDQVYSYIYSNPQIDFSRYDALDLDAFREGVRASINERVGGELIHQVLVEQIDYLSKQEIRDRAGRQG
ncbi:hypothetical protein [Mesorhizobium xinjiangense]|uniref:hypothetical protein n=1 Tax=Mesorhizobium xinjiangense TaxID=2678685 RepID=UPI0012ECBC41|nr:hypothetical protein [Mesorhizobium xinjiangense]